jgi:hypothetical protein
VPRVLGSAPGSSPRRAAISLGSENSALNSCNPVPPFYLYSVGSSVIFKLRGQQNQKFYEEICLHTHHPGALVSLNLLLSTGSRPDSMKPQILICYIWSGLLLLLQAQEAPQITSTLTADGIVEISWPSSARLFRLETSLILGPSPSWQTVPQAAFLSGDRWLVSVIPLDTKMFFRLTDAPAGATIRETSPAAGESGVAVTRETIIRFSEPLAEGTTLSSDRFQALFGGRALLARPELSSDRRTATLFYLENLPASATVTVRFDGNGMRDANGTLLDADGDGTEGGIFVMQFNTLGNTPLDGTGVVGQVFASEAGSRGTNRPLEGITITVDGAEETLRAVTDAQGFFHLFPSPAGRFFVHVDGRTAKESAWPNAAFYPTVGKAWAAAPGKSNNLAGGNGQIFLPLIPADALQPVSAIADTVVKVSNSVISTNPAFANVAITVPANALFSDNGARGGRVGLAPVAPDRLPEPLPAGLEMPIVITVQTDGPLNFDRPAPVCFPNLPDPVLGIPLAPGSRQALISFNHDKGRWEAVGTMTVSADGTLICSDPGSGILQPGWHGTGPQPVGPKPVVFHFGLPKADGDDDDNEDNDFCVGPDPKMLEACLQGSDDVLKKCELAAEISLDARLRVCRNIDNLEVRLACTASAWDKFRRDLSTCIIELEEDTESCIDCFGVPQDDGVDEDDVPPAGGFSVQDGATRTAVMAAAASVDDLVDAKFDELFAVLSQDPLPAPEVLANAVQEILDDLDALTGNDLRGFLLNSIMRIDRERVAGMPVPFLEIGSVPPRPVKYAAHILRPSGDFYIRGNTEAFLNYQIFVPRDGLLVAVDFYDPVRNRLGHIVPDYRPEAEYGLPRVLLHPVSPEEIDTDGDGLVDVAEHVFGTDATQPDTDDDGVPDGAEVQQGTNPLDGAPMELGPIASVRTLGAAVDVAALNNVAVVAEGTAGISVFDTKNIFNPVRVAQVDTPGDARAVVLEGALAAVADGNGGLAILNVAIPGNASIIRQVALAGEAVAVAVADNLAYVGLANGRVAVVEMTSGQGFETVDLGANSLADLLIVDDVLFVLAEEKLFALPLDQGALQIATMVQSPGTAQTGAQRVRLTSGGGLLYAAHNAGFNVFNVADPLAPVLVHHHMTAQRAWKQMVPNGSGLGVAVVGVNPTQPSTFEVYLHDLNPVGTNAVFLTLLRTPGIAGAVSIYNGLTYLADGPNGLLVLNYTEADTMKIPPRIELKANFPLGAISQAPSASPARVKASVSDDVQVRNVEFYLDGQLIAADGNFPFEARFITPLLTATKTNFVIQARAFDTGGNSTSSDIFTVNLRPDSSSPKVRRVSPTGGGRVIDRVTAYFTEVVDAGKLNATSFQILSAGVDGLLDTGDDLLLSNASYSVRAENLSASARFSQPLPNGLYRVTLTPGITDPNNNPLEAPINWDFRVGNASYWTGSFTGSWQDPANWSTGAVPGTNDNVVIDVSYGTGRIIIEEADRARNLELFEELEVLSGSSLEVTDNLTAHRDLVLNGGIIRNTVINLLDGSLIQAERGVGSTLRNVTVNGNIVTEGSDWLQFQGGLTLNGTLTLSTNGSVIFGDSQTMTDGIIQFAGNSRVDNAQVLIQEDAIVTWGPGVVVRGRTGTISGGGKLINQGKISVDGVGEHIWVHPVTFTHNGTAEVINGAHLTFGSSGNNWDGAGAISVLNGTFTLAGPFGPITTLITNGLDGTVQITGNGNLQGSTLTLNAETGSWILEGGTLRNGTLNLAEGASFRVRDDASLLQEMTINGDLVLDDGSLNFRGGLTLNGILLLRGNTFIRFLDSQTMTSGTIEFAGALQGSGVPQVVVQSGATVTFEPSVLVHGLSGTISGAGTVINQGKISADAAGGTIRISPANFVNQGILEAINGGALVGPESP